MIVLLHGSQDKGQAGHCCSLKHLFRLPWKSCGRNFLDEAKKEVVLEALAHEVARDEINPRP